MANVFDSNVKTSVHIGTNLQSKTAKQAKSTYSRTFSKSLAGISRNESAVSKCNKPTSQGEAKGPIKSHASQYSNSTTAILTDNQTSQIIHNILKLLSELLVQISSGHLSSTDGSTGAGTSTNSPAAHPHNSTSDFQISIGSGANSVAININGFGPISVDVSGETDRPWRPADGKPGGHHHSNHAKPIEAGEAFTRLVPAGDEARTGEFSGQHRPDPRTISNAVADQGFRETENRNGASDMLWSWGQFIDHDIALSREGEEPANILVPRGDPDLDPKGNGRSFVPFTRSATEVDANGIHQQINDQTPFVDASMVYGASSEKTDQLRSFEGGKLKLDADGHLPPDVKDKVLAGDPRAAEQPGLLSLHTLFAREHNRVAGIVSKNNPHMNDEAVFNEARRVTTNEIQAITYNEFLPILIGENHANPDNYRYGPGKVDGSVSNEFATGAYRLGHTLVSNQVAIKKSDGSLEKVDLARVFFQPEFTKEHGISAVLAGQSEQTAERVDPIIVDSLRNQLFGLSDGGPVLDLAALNIQRGRDHNLPSYNEMRQSMGMALIENFDDPAFQHGVGAKLASAYDHPDDIDLWVGGLSEKPSGSSMLGETFTRIVGDQFARLARADANFYTHNANRDEKAWLNNLTLSDIIRANDPNAQIDDTAFIATDNRYA